MNVINLKYIKVSLFEISFKKKWIFSPYSIFFFLDVPVYDILKNTDYLWWFIPFESLKGE